MEESWLVGKLRLLPKSGDLSNPNNWRGITLLFLEISFIAHSTEEKTRFVPKAAAREAREAS